MEQYNKPQFECPHATTVMVRLDCGAGGTQCRRYCRKCWGPIGGAMPHAVAQAEMKRTGIEAPLASLEVLHAAQDAYWRDRRAGS